uniref:Fucosyltransferase, N-terminal n=1 Tax=Candidatus Kentrum sp. DK TaxID=2126562 RepID=A0A450SQ43_9GAMM|nr:MAG: Fucosyltransferase, N-terminal [Candidatus Kentron sp. DK]
MENSSKTLIVFFNTLWGQPLKYESLPPDCEITTNHDYLPEADAVVFHIPDMGDIDKLPKPAGQIWVAWSMESEAHYPQLLDPEFMARFDLRMTYHLDADVIAPYFMPEMLMVDELRTLPLPKSGLVCYFSSSGNDRSGRDAYVRELMRFVDVHSYGRTLQNRVLEEDKGRETKLETCAKYKFTLGLENACTVDYVTEKFFEPLIVGSVPIYLGAPNVAEFAPGENCFINASDFAPAELAAYLKKLDNDDALYQAYLVWKGLPFRQRFQELVEVQQKHPFVRLYERIPEARVRIKGR